MNSRIEKPTRNASARAMLLVLGLPSRPSRIMKNSAEPRLPMMADERQEHQVFHGGDYPVTPCPFAALLADHPGRPGGGRR